MTHVIEENTYDDYDTLALSISTITAFLSPHGSPKYATMYLISHNIHTKDKSRGEKYFSVATPKVGLVTVCEKESKLRVINFTKKP